MRAVVQRVVQADVTVDEKITGAIEKGLMVLLGVEDEDEEADAAYMAEKIAGLRIFEDEEGKMNLSVKDVGGDLLVGIPVHLIRRLQERKAAELYQSRKAGKSRRALPEVCSLMPGTGAAR